MIVRIDFRGLDGKFHAGALHACEQSSGFIVVGSIAELENSVEVRRRSRLDSGRMCHALWGHYNSLKCANRHCRWPSVVPILIGLPAKDVARKSLGLVWRNDKIRHVCMVLLQKHLYRKRSCAMPIGDRFEARRLVKQARHVRFDRVARLAPSFCQPMPF